MAPIYKTRSKSAAQSARNAVKSSRSSDQKVLDRNIMKSLVATVLKKEKDIKMHGKERLPHNYYKNLISPFLNLMPTLSEKSLKNAVSYEKRKNLTQRTVPPAADSPPSVLCHSSSSNNSPSISSSSNNPPSINDNTSSDIQPTVQKKGRPNKENLRTTNITYCEAANEITHMAMEVKRREGALTNESFEMIVSEVREKRNLPENFEIKRGTVKKRIQKNRTVVDAHRHKGGVDTPLAEVEPVIVEMDHHYSQ